MSSNKDYDIDSSTKTITVYNTKGVGKLITSLQFLLKEWKDYKIIIHKQDDESKTDI
jgi:hypothetical protein